MSSPRITADWLENAWVAIRRRKWGLVLCAYLWAWLCYTAMNLLDLLKNTELFPTDVIPVLAGPPIIIASYYAIGLRQRMFAAVDTFDDGAAFEFPAGKSGAKEALVSDLRAAIKMWSRLFAWGLAGVSTVGTLLVTYDQYKDDLAYSLNGLTLLLVVGVPLISLPAGELLGELVGFGQLERVMDRNGVKFAGVSTPPAREALRGLQTVRTFAVIVTAVMSIWFSIWWIGWKLKLTFFVQADLWDKQFLILWVVSIVLFILTAALPASRFKARIESMLGGAEGRQAVNRQIAEAEGDRSALLARMGGTPRQRQDRAQIAALDAFINNLKQQKFITWPLSTPFHLAIIALNVALYLVPPLLGDGHWI